MSSNSKEYNKKYNEMIKLKRKEAIQDSKNKSAHREVFMATEYPDQMV